MTDIKVDVLLGSKQQVSRLDCLLGFVELKRLTSPRSILDFSSNIVSNKCIQKLTDDISQFKTRNRK